MTDELTESGDASLELHAASVQSRSGMTTRRVGQGLAELSYGISRTLEVSLQVPVAMGPEWKALGANVELQYVAPHDQQFGSYWGVRTEIGRTGAALEPDVTTSLEFRPIVGYRLQAWHAALNGAVRAPLSGRDRRLKWEPAAKILREVAAKTQFGVEFYVQSAQNPAGVGDGSARRKLALLILDTKLRSADLSVGIGRGIGPSADGLVTKFIAGFEL